MAILAYILIIIIPIALLAFGLRAWIRYESAKESSKDKEGNKTIAYIYSYSGPLKAIGFITAIIFCIALWNFRYEFKVVIEAEKETELILDLFDLSINTEQKKPPKPQPILTPKIIETPEEEITKDPDIDLEKIPEKVDPIQGTDGDEDSDEDEEEIVFDDKIYSTAELQHLPGFPGGRAGLSAYMLRNMKIPPSVRKRGITGKIYVGFVIDKDGKVTDVTILRGLTPAMDKEALRVVKNMPAWDPGFNGGIAVKVRQSLPIKIAY